MRKREPFNYRIEHDLKENINSLALELSYKQNKKVFVTDLLEEAISDLLKKYEFKKK